LFLDITGTRRSAQRRLTSDEAGKIQGVHYEELAPMLLNEI
jgi:hypothetical protein